MVFVDRFPKVSLLSSGNKSVDLVGKLSSQAIV